MSEIIFAITFAMSFALYALLRHFDVASTRAFLKYLDADKHEVNPLINWLLKRGVSLNRSFNLMLLLFGIPIALGDALLNTYLALGIPFFAWAFGSFHIIASVNNYGYLPKIQRMKPHEIREEEANNFAFGMEFGKANLRKKISLLGNRRGFGLGMTLLSIVAFALVYYSIAVAGLGQIEMLFAARGYSVLSAFNMGAVLAFALLAFYPVKVMAEITMAKRYYSLSKSNEIITKVESQDATSQSGWMDVSTDELKNAIKLADENNSKTVKIWIGSADT